MKISRAGIELVKRWEGCRLRAYQDSVGVWTIGYGHTSMAGDPKVTPGMKITQQEAEDILVRDLVKYEAAVQKALTRSPTQPQFDAMTSLCFNIGQGAFAKSSIAKKFNAGDVQGAADAFLLYNKAGGKVLQGLVNRREDERKHFLKEAPQKPVEPAQPPPAPVHPPAPETPPAAAPEAGKSIAGWVMTAVAALLAVLAAWIIGGK